LLLRRNEQLRILEGLATDLQRQITELRAAEREKSTSTAGWTSRPLG